MNIKVLLERTGSQHLHYGALFPSSNGFDVRLIERQDDCVLIEITHQSKTEESDLCESLAKIFTNVTVCQ